MKNILHKKHIITSYNINYKGQIIAGADQCLLADKSIVLEIFPFDNLEATGLQLSPEDQWKDNQTIEPAALDEAVTTIVLNMVATMIQSFPVFKNQVTITLRKQVYGITIEKNGVEKDLIMVYRFEKFVADQEDLCKAIYVHDREGFEFWKLDIDAGEEEIYQTIYPVIKVLKSRNQ